MSMRYIVRKLRIMKPAPASSTSVSASCDDDQRAGPAPRADASRPGSAAFLQHFVDVGLRRRAAREPGRKRCRSPGTRARKNANVRQSIVNTIQYGLPTFCVSAANQRMPTIDSSNAEAAGDEAPAARSRSAADARSASGSRRAATRTLISRERRAARASSRFATFEHAMSSTKPTAPISDQNSRRSCGPSNPLDEWVGSGQILVGRRDTVRQPLADRLELRARLLDRDAVGSRPTAK